MKNKEKQFVTLMSALPLGLFFSKRSADGELAKGTAKAFRGWPGDARAKGKAKRKKIQQAARQVEINRIYDHRKAKNNKRHQRLLNRRAA